MKQVKQQGDKDANETTLHYPTKYVKKHKKNQNVCNYGVLYTSVSNLYRKFGEFCLKNRFLFTTDVGFPFSCLHSSSRPSTFDLLLIIYELSEYVAYNNNGSGT